jgi:hypothetical protein
LSESLDQDARDRIERACERLSIAYARGVDYRDYDLVADLFTEDGHLDAGFPLDSRDAIRRALLRRPDELRSRHVLTNIFIDVVSRSRARGISYLTLYRHVGEESLAAGPAELVGPAGVGHYEDSFELTDDGWRIARRKLHFAFRRSDAFPEAKRPRTGQ